MVPRSDRRKGFRIIHKSPTQPWQTVAALGGSIALRQPGVPLCALPSPCWGHQAY